MSGKLSTRRTATRGSDDHGKAAVLDVLAAVAHHAAVTGDRIFHISRDQQLTFAELAHHSDQVAQYLLRDSLQAGSSARPVVVYGHKQTWMPVCFLGAVKAGQPYVPVDSSLPAHRVADIIATSGASTVFAVEPLAETPDGCTVVSLDHLEQLCAGDEPSPSAEAAVGESDPFYIIFTSGSTGQPKGVQISRQAINNFVEWALNLGWDESPAFAQRYINQAPFSFDLSAFELMMSLASGSTMVSLDRGHTAKLKDLFDELGSSGATVWVSTPSFAELCLASDSFNCELLPELRVFLFCGEVLSVETARRLNDRFPAATVVNTYGPTESTVAVTSVVCDDALLDASTTLPVGTPKPGTDIHILDGEGRECAEGVTGEIIIAGNTVSLGYWARPDLTEVAFGVLQGTNGPQPCYRTGDAGYLMDGTLFFVGRLDFQVKLHGYRIEIEDIEANLRRLETVVNAIVVPMETPGGFGTVSHLHAVVQLLDGPPEKTLRTTIALKSELKGLIPDYMVPKSFTYVETLPLTTNGKADRKTIKGSLA